MFLAKRSGDGEGCKGERGFMVKRWIRAYIVLVFLIVLLVYGNETPESEEQGTIEVTETDKTANSGQYQRINRNLLGSFMEGIGTEFFEIGVSQYFKEKDGWMQQFEAVTDRNSSFPQEMVTDLEEVLYQYHENRTIYASLADFSLLHEKGLEDFKLDTEEKFLLFPQVAVYREDIEQHGGIDALINWFYEIPEHCTDIFRIHGEQEQDNYIFVYYPQGFRGNKIAVRVTERKGDEFKTINEFEIEKNENECATHDVIKYGDVFYYVYLKFNEEEDTYDRIHVYRLNDNPEREILQISFLPRTYIWDPLYDAGDGFPDLEWSDCIEKTEEKLLGGNYLNGGTGEVPEIYYGNSEKETASPSEKCKDIFYRADIANCSLPVYIQKGYGQSADEKSRFLKVCFYYFDSEIDNMVKLSDLSVDKWLPQGMNPAQMWFEEVEGKIYTFRLYHLSDYNYLLSVVLLEGNKVSYIRTYALLPLRSFHVEVIAP